MPNHCHNDLYVHGAPDDVAALLALIGADQTPPRFEFGAVIPYPAEWAALDNDMEELGYAGFRDKHGPDAKDGFNSGGYEWRIQEWGTKWCAYEVTRRDYLGVCVTFQTAWSPPKKVVEALHKLHPKCSLHLEFFERGGAYTGGFSCVAEDDWYEDEPWASSARTQEWEGRYHGSRGG